MGSQYSVESSFKSFLIKIVAINHDHKGTNSIIKKMIPREVITYKH